MTDHDTVDRGGPEGDSRDDAVRRRIDPEDRRVGAPAARLEHTLRRDPDRTGAGGHPERRQRQRDSGDGSPALRVDPPERRAAFLRRFSVGRYYDKRIR